MTSREVARAARLLADQQTAKIQGVQSPFFRAKVTTVTAGAASDGNALVKITYQGVEMPASDYPNSYTPTVNDRVLCAWVDGQPSIIHRGIGFPP